MSREKHINATAGFTGLSSRSAKSITLTIQLGHGHPPVIETVKVAPTKANCQHWFKRLQEIQFKITDNSFVYFDYFPRGKNSAKFAYANNDKKNIGIRLNDFLTEIMTVNKNEFSHSTIQTYRNIIQHDLIPEFGRLYAGELGHAELTKWTDTLMITQKTLNNKCAPLRRILDTAIREGAITHNIFRQCPPEALKNSSYEIDAFTKDEQAAILAQEMPEHLLNMITFWFFTGLRSSEIYGLTWNKYNKVKRTLTIDASRVLDRPKDTAKTKAGNREFPLLSRARAALENQYTLMNQKQLITKDSERFIFSNPKTGKPWTYVAFTRLWTKVLKQAGIRYRPPYNMRHTFATMMVALAGDRSLYHVTQALGHRSETTTRNLYVDSNVIWVPADWSDVDEYLSR